MSAQKAIEREVGWLGEKGPLRTKKQIPIRGGVVAELEVKTVLKERVYINCVDTVPPKRLETDQDPDPIRKGAIVARHDEGGTGANLLFQVFDGGVFDYLLATGYHVGSSSDRDVRRMMMHAGTLRWALQASWNITKDSSPDEVRAYQQAVTSIEKELKNARDPKKQVAREASGRARSLHDRRGRLNTPRLAPIIWMAEQALTERIRVSHHIRPRISERHWAVIDVLDRAWEFVDAVEVAVAEVLDALTPAKRERITPGRARRYETDLGQLADDLDHISLAPFSRRAFPHIARDLRQGFLSLRRNTFEDAAKAFDKIRRSIVMTRARRSLEEIRVQANRFRTKEAAAKIHPDDVQGLLDALETVVNTLIVNGHPIDEDFTHPVIATSVMPMYFRARGGAMDEEGYQGERVYQSIKAKAEPL